MQFPDDPRREIVRVEISADVTVGLSYTSPFTIGAEPVPSIKSGNAPILRSNTLIVPSLKSPECHC
jgi:hypothetical protein